MQTDWHIETYTGTDGKWNARATLPNVPGLEVIASDLETEEDALLMIRDSLSQYPEGESEPEKPKNEEKPKASGSKISDEDMGKLITLVVSGALLIIFFGLAAVANRPAPVSDACRQFNDCTPVEMVQLQKESSEGWNAISTLLNQFYEAVKPLIDLTLSMAGFGCAGAIILPMLAAVAKVTRG